MWITILKFVIFGRYVVVYTVGNYVLRLRWRVAVKKLKFRPYIRRYTSPNDKFQYSYPLSFLLYIAEFSKHVFMLVIFNGDDVP